MKRKEILTVGEYYHVFNRGVEKRKIFQSKNDYNYFLNCLILFNTNKPSWSDRSNREDRPHKEEWLVDIVAYCLNPNHFHLLLKERKENGISTFMKKVCTGYAMYFNNRNKRTGALFQGRFKSVHLDTNDLLLYLSVYINCNSEVHGIEKASKYQWCSWSEYIDNVAGIGCQKENVLSQFKNFQDYKVFCYEKLIGMKNRKDMDKFHQE